MDNLLEYFGKDNGKILKDLLRDKSAADNMNNFLKTYAFDLIIMIAVVFWHILFLIIMGFIMSWIICGKIYDLDKAVSGGNVDVNSGWKLLLWGMFNGTTNYLAGIALEGMMTTLIQMVGFNGKAGETTSSSKVFSYPTAGG